MKFSYKTLLGLICLIYLLFQSITISAQIYGEEIITFDFNDGIPADWENISTSNIGLWEYRGPSTDPNISVASRGSCGSSSDPISSSTRENGFVIFDSNYWDDEMGPCGNLASGIDPGPHFSDLITGPLDFSDEGSLVLTFQQQYKNFQNATWISISIDGGDTFSPVIENSAQTGFYSGDLDYTSVNISSLAGNQSDVRIKFHFEGLYYYWMIDDIVIYKPNDNDLFMTDSRYTAFDFTQAPEGFGKMEFSIYPNSMLTPLQFHADVLNIGNNDQTEVSLEATIKNSSDQVLDIYTSTPSTIEPGFMSTLITDEYTPLDQPGKYTVDFLIVQEQEDEDLLNNISSNEYKISDHTLARDRYEVEGVFEPAVEFTESHFELGNYFECTLMDSLKCTSISVALHEGTDIGSEIYGVLYNFSRDSIYAQTETYIVNEWDLNGEGESKFVTLQLTDPHLISDTLFLASIGSFQEDESVIIGVSGTSPPHTSLISYPSNNAIFYTLETPMVRANIFRISETPGCTNISALNFNAFADVDDGSCRISGCTNELLPNYNPEANFEDGSCTTIGCDDPEADNYDIDVDIIDNTTCIFSGCTNPEAINYDDIANEDDGSCLFDNAVFDTNALFGCAPFELEITNQTLLSENAECNFNLGDGTIIETCEPNMFTHLYSEPGIYYITYTYTVGDFVSSAEATITVFESIMAPELSYVSSSNQIFCSNCENENIYNWILDGEVVLENAPFDIINPEDGTYILELDNGSNCTAQSEPLLVSGISNYEKESISLYPNPAQDFIIISSAESNTEFIISNLNGKRIASGNLINSGNHTLDISHFAHGVYILQFTTGNSSNKKFIKY